MPPFQEEPSPTAIAYQWASHIMTIAAEMVVPGIIGLWLDRRYGTKVLFTISGFLLGFGVGFWHLIRWVNGMKNDGH